jgi:MerR family mercuric resistance operon transcriptional regulator
MRIGELARTTGVSAQTIRFYERQGLLPFPGRETNGYRQYDDDAATRLQFIRASQTAGLTLTDISSVLALRQAGETPCGHVTTLLTSRLDDVRARQRELALLATELEHALDASRTLDPAGCTASNVCQIITGSHKALP